MNEIVLSTFLCNLLLICFSIMNLCWAATAIQSMIYDHKDQKRKEEAAKRDEEYHAKRMEALQ